MLSLIHTPKGQVDAWGVNDFGRRQIMKPVGLRGPLHHQQAAVF